MTNKIQYLLRKMLGIEERIAQEVAELETALDAKYQELDSKIDDIEENEIDWSDAENNIDWSSVFYNNEIINKDEVREEAEDVFNELFDDKFDEKYADEKEPAVDINSTEFENLVNRAVENYLKDATFTLSFNKSDNK